MELPDEAQAFCRSATSCFVQLSTCYLHGPAPATRFPSRFTEVRVPAMRLQIKSRSNCANAVTTLMMKTSFDAQKQAYFPRAASHSSAPTVAFHPLALSAA